ncbi:MAG: hypothetical protein NC911_10515 [Candidatus Omnitrophica bacterium]|nr:hypothetical protein [Candidatus Omnitrophota bacterium]
MKRVILAGSLWVFIFSALAQVKTEVKTGGPTGEEVLKYEGPKARIAVARFDVKSPKAIWQMGDGLRDMLVDALFKTGRFIVLEKDSLVDLQEEFKLGEEGWSKKAPEKGTFEAADIVVSGAITGFEPQAEGAGGGGIVIPLPFGAGVAIKKEEAYIQATIRLIDVRTRRVINSTTVEGKASKSKLGLAAGGVAGPVILGGGFEKYKNTPTAQAVGIMVENAVKEIVRLVPEDYYKHIGKTAGYKNEPDGFRGIKWGTPLSSLTGMKLVKDAGNLKEYQKEDDVLQIGQAKLEKITYSFYQGLLESITAETKGKENFEQLKTAAQERFGAGHQRSEDEWCWEGSTTSIFLQRVPAEGKGFLKMVSEEMKKKQQSAAGF